MDIQTKLNYILEQQSKNVNLETIAENLNMTIKAVRSFMGRQGYNSKKGVFIKKEENTATSAEQLTLGVAAQVSEKIDIIPKRSKKVNTSISVDEEEITEPSVVLKYVAESTKKSGTLELTSEFLDMIYELRDWYNEVKELPQLKHKITRKNKDVITDESLINEPLSKRIQTDKELWESLSRLSENSGTEINILITQAIKNLLKDYKHLI